MAYARRSWLLGTGAMLFGLGLYHFDNWYERMPSSLMRSLLDRLELTIIGPGMGFLGMMLSENARLKNDAYRRRLSEERDRRFHMLGRIAASVAHEVRNPLHNLRLISDELRLAPPDAQRPLIDRVDGNIERLDLVVRLVYELARPGAPLDDVDIPAVALPDLLDSVLAEETRRLGGAVRVDHRRPTAPVLVHAREPALRIVLHNLVRNALQASGMVEIRYVEHPDSWECALVNPGTLPREVLAGHEPLASSKPDGLGVGISIARHLAASLNGTLAFAQEGENVRVSVRIQRAPRAGLGVREAGSRQQISSPAFPQSPTPRRPPR